MSVQEAGFVDALCYGYDVVLCWMLTAVLMLSQQMLMLGALQTLTVLMKRM